MTTGSEDTGRQSADCPDEHLVAGYVDGGLALEQREWIERHLADCGHCLDLVGLLAQERDLADLADLEPVREDLLERARAHVKPRRARTWLPAPQWAAAAALVLAVPILLQLGRQGDVTETIDAPARPESVTRSIGASRTSLQVLAPAPGAAVDAGRLSVRWMEVPGSPYYDVRIVTDAGDVVVEQRVTGTTWMPPAQLHLRPGADYFVHIDAYPSGDKAVSSDHVPFRVAN